MKFNFKNKKTKKWLLLTVLLLSSILVSLQGAYASILYEYYNTGDSTYWFFYGNTWAAQTFTVGDIAYNITSVKLLLFRTGIIGTVTVSIRTTVSGHPNGPDLTSGTTNGNTLPTDHSGEWREITVSSYNLSANTKYAIVVRCEGTDISNSLRWRSDEINGYSGGNGETSTVAGSSWSTQSYDLMFEVYGLEYAAPTYSSIAHSSVRTSSPSTFSCYWNDNADLSHYIFSTNNTGSWVNDTATAFSSTPSWANVTKSLNGTADLVVGYRWFANDTSNNWNSTGIQTLTTFTDVTPPTYSAIGHVGDTGGASASFYLYANDDYALGTYIFSYKIGEGSYTNLTGASFASTPGWANLSRTLPTQNTTFYFKYFFSDSFGNWNTTSEESFAVTYVSEPTPTATPTAEPTATPAATPTPAPIIVGDTSNLYFRSDTYETLNVSAYGLDQDVTSESVTSTVRTDIDLIEYGIRVYLVTNENESTELTSTYSAKMTLTSNSTGNYTGYVNGYWTIPRTTVVLGYQALQVDVYSYTPTYGWNLEHSFISGVLMTKEIVSSQLTFKLYVNISFLEPGELGGTGDVFCSYIFGDVDHKSGIYGLSVTTPTQSEIELWRLNSGDYVGFVVGAYYDVIGAGFYALLLLLFAGVLYFRYGHFGVVAVFFVLFGGVGGLVWLFLPLWAAGVAAAFIILGTTFIVWRVIR